MRTYRQHANQADTINRRVAEVIAEGKTPFQDYLFFRSSVHGVCIALDGDIQSCQADEAIYHEALVHPALLLHENPQSVLVMGGGEGATIREVLRHPSVRKVVMVDIDRDFVALCQKWVPQWAGNAFSDSRLELHYSDINKYLQRCQLQFDVVIGDLVDIHDWNAQTAQLYATQFYKILKTHMRNNALLVTQAGAMVTGGLQGHKLIRAALAEQFCNVYSYGMVIPSFYHQWGFVLASLAVLDTSIVALSERFKRRDGAVRCVATGSDALAAAFCLPKIVQAELE